MKLKCIGILLVTISLISCKENTIQSHKEVVSTHTKPNIIYILADDLGVVNFVCP